MSILPIKYLSIRNMRLSFAISPFKLSNCNSVRQLVAFIYREYRIYDAYLCVSKINKKNIYFRVNKVFTNKLRLCICNGKFNLRITGITSSCGSRTHTHTLLLTHSSHSSSIKPNLLKLINK